MVKRYEKELLPKKTRLLLYIMDKDLFEIWGKDIHEVFSKEPITMTTLQKELGYKSPSHIHQDLRDLRHQGYIEFDESKNEMNLTKKGRELTKPYSRIRTLALVLVVVGFGIFPFLLYLEEWSWLYSILLGGASIVCGFFISFSYWQLVKQKIVF
jgi:predicted transcriptional regulator